MRLLMGANINDQIVANDQAVIFKNGTFWDDRNEPFGIDDKAVFVGMHFVIITDCNLAFVASIVLQCGPCMGDYWMLAISVNTSAD